MRKRRFAAEQILTILREAERGERTIGEICRAHGVSEHSFYRWRQKYSGLEVSEARGLRELGTENAGLKRLLANRDLEINAMEELLAKK